MASAFQRASREGILSALYGEEGLRDLSAPTVMNDMRSWHSTQLFSFQSSSGCRVP